VIVKVRDFCQGATIVIAWPQRQKRSYATDVTKLFYFATLLRYSRLQSHVQWGVQCSNLQAPQPLRSEVRDWAKHTYADIRCIVREVSACAHALPVTLKSAV